MEGNKVDTKDLPSVKQQSLGDVLDELCAYYMAIGVSYDEFWFGDYTRLKYYERKHEYENDQKSQEMWMQGIYFASAIGCALNGKKCKYIEKPFEMREKTDVEKELQEIQERNKVIAYFERQVALQKKRKKKESKNNG